MLLFVIVLLLFFIAIYKPMQGLIAIMVCYPTISMLSFPVNIVLVGLWGVWIGFTLKKDNKRQLEIEKFPFLHAFAVSAISYILTFVFSNDLSRSLTLINRSREYVLAIFLWHIFVSKKSNHILLIKWTVIYVTILTTYGIIEAFTHNNPVIDFLFKGNLVGSIQEETYVRYGLYRAQSLTIWCSAFGIASCMGLILVGHYYFSNFRHHFLRPSFFVLYFILCAFAVICCGTRSVYLVTTLACLSFLPYFKKSTMRLLIPVIVIVILALQIYGEFFQTIIDSMLNQDSFGGGASSFDMRETQWEMTLFITKESFWLGRGLGTVPEMTSLYDDLHGAESILFTTMIERGALGLLSVFYFYGSIILWMVKKSQYKLILVLVAFIVGKLLSLLPGSGECYILLIIIPLYKLFNDSNKRQIVQSGKMKLVR